MIPIYNVLINDNETGIDKISLVQSPAVESNFLAFAKGKKQVLFSSNEEQQMITGVLMRADFPIYRYDEYMGEYYLQFSKDTIQIMAEKLLCDNNQNRVNVEHLAESDVENVNMVQLFIKDSVKGVNPVGFDDITDGSLFATFKVRNPQIWNNIKNGNFKGFSIEGLFGYELATEENADVYDEIMNVLNKIENKIEKNKLTNG